MESPATETFDQIVERVEINEIRAVSFSANSANGDTLGESELSIDLKDRTRWTLSESRKDLDALVDFEIRLANKVDDGAEFLAAITFCVSYTFDRSLPKSGEVEKALRLFAENNARFNAWPFLREYVNYASSYMGLPAVTLPLLKPYARTKRKAKELAKVSEVRENAEG